MTDEIMYDKMINVCHTFINFFYSITGVSYYHASPKKFKETEFIFYDYSLETFRVKMNFVDYKINMYFYNCDNYISFFENILEQTSSIQNESSYFYLMFDTLNLNSSDSKISKVNLTEYQNWANL